MAKELEKEYAKWKALKESHSKEEEDEYEPIAYRKRIAYHGTWTDRYRKVLVNLLLSYYPYDNSVALYDLDIGIPVLHRTQSDYTSDDFFIGARIMIYSKPVIINSYADEYSRKVMSSKITITFAIIKPSGMPYMGPIINYIGSKGFNIVRCKMVWLTKEEVTRFYEELKGTPYMPFLTQHLSSGAALAMVLSNVDAILAFREAMGHPDPIKAKEENPISIRARFGINRVENAIHGSSSEAACYKEMTVFFPDNEDLSKGIPPCALLKNPILCLIKAHVLKDHFVGNIIEDIMDCGFNVTGMQMVNLTIDSCNDFLSVYRGVINNYGGLIDELLSGPVIAMEITTSNKEPDFHAKFKLLTGPENPVVARLINPTSLRARYGHTVLKNAVIVTALPIDGLLECSYFFNTA